MVKIVDRLIDRMSGPYSFSHSKIMRDTKKIDPSTMFELLDEGPERFTDYIKTLRRYGHYLLFTFDDGKSEMSLSANGHIEPILIQRFFRDSTIMDKTKMSRSDYLRYVLGMVFMSHTVSEPESILFKLRQFIDRQKIRYVVLQHREDAERMIIARSNMSYDMHVCGNGIVDSIIKNMMGIGKSRNDMTPDICIGSTNIFPGGQRRSLRYSNINHGPMIENILDIMTAVIYDESDKYRAIIVIEHDGLNDIISISRRDIVVNGRLFSETSDDVNIESLRLATDLIDKYDIVSVDVPPI